MFWLEVAAFKAHHSLPRSTSNATIMNSPIRPRGGVTYPDLELANTTDLYILFSVFTVDEGYRSQRALRRPRGGGGAPPLEAVRKIWQKRTRGEPRRRHSLG